jgi:hypothetical protein
MANFEANRTGVCLLNEASARRRGVDILRRTCDSPEAVRHGDPRGPLVVKSGSCRSEPRG